MKAYGWLGIAAAALLVVGLVVGFSPVKSGGYDCGSAFHESSGLFKQQMTDTLTGGTGENDCDAARSSRQPVAWAAIAVGGAARWCRARDARKRPLEEHRLRDMTKAPRRGLHGGRGGDGAQIWAATEVGR